MKIESLREFLAFADCLSFSAAARRLNMTQPALSKHVRAIEEELGCDLVERTGQVRLTPAGKAFVKGAFRTVEDYDNTLAAVADAARHGLPVKVHEYAIGSAALLAVVRDSSDIQIQVIPKRADASMVDSVADGTIDIGMLGCPCIDDDLQRRLTELGIVATALKPGYSSICMKVTNPLAAKRDCLSRHDLEGVPITVFSPEDSDYQIDTIRSMLGDDLDLHFQCQPLENDDDIYLTDLGDSIHICGADANRRHLVYRNDMIVVEHLVDAELVSRSWLIYLRDNPNPNVKTLVERLANAG